MAITMMGDAIREGEQHNLMAFQEGDKIEEWVMEDVEPIQQHQNLLLDKEMDATIWVHQNLIKLGKMFGVDFQGHEEETLQLLKQIDKSRQPRRMEAESSIKRPRFKGAQELKDLTTFDVKFKNGGKRNRGKGGNCL